MRLTYGYPGPQATLELYCYYVDVWYEQYKQK